jgi:lipocalin
MMRGIVLLIGLLSMVSGVITNLRYKSVKEDPKQMILDPQMPPAVDTSSRVEGLPGINQEDLFRHDEWLESSHDKVVHAGKKSPKFVEKNVTPVMDIHDKIVESGQQRTHKHPFLANDKSHTHWAPDPFYGIITEKENPFKDIVAPAEYTERRTEDNTIIADTVDTEQECPFMKIFKNIFPKVNFNRGVAQTDLSEALGVEKKIPVFTRNGKWVEAVNGKYNGSCPFLQSINTRPDWLFPKTVDDVDLQAFSGVYFQTHASSIPLATYEKDKYCITANYGNPGKSSFLGIFEDVTTFTVEYNGNKGSPQGEQGDGMHALSWQFDPVKAPGKLVVTADDKFWSISQLRIIRVGPISKRDGKYEYAVVTDAMGTSIFILARNPKKFREKYQVKLFEELEKIGFDKDWNRPYPTYQGYDCNFPQYVYDSLPVRPSGLSETEEDIFGS